MAWNTDATASSYLTFKTVNANTLAERLRITSAGDIYSDAWTDISGTSTIVGWSSFTTKLIQYKRIGKLVFVKYELVGTSNSVLADFTLPFTNNSQVDVEAACLIRDNGSAFAMSRANMPASDTRMFCYPTPAAGNWTNTGTKDCRGQFFFQTT